jgi:hypothetical protein
MGNSNYHHQNVWSVERDVICRRGEGNFHRSIGRSFIAQDEKIKRPDHDSAMHQCIA